MYARTTYTTGTSGSNVRTMSSLNASSTNTTNSSTTSTSTHTDVIYAIAIDDLDQVKRLVNSSNVNNIVDSKNNFTSLHIAISKSSNSDIVKYLLSIGANPDLKTKSNADSYDLAFDHRNRHVFNYAVEKANAKVDELLVKNDSLNAKINDLTDKNQYLTKSNEKYSEKLRTELIPIKSQLTTSNNEVSRITKLYDEKKDECNNLKRKVDDLIVENTKLKRDLNDAENALGNILKKHKK
jgi:chromosome segregation ATPase